MRILWILSCLTSQVLFAQQDYLHTLDSSKITKPQGILLKQISIRAVSAISHKISWMGANHGLFVQNNNGIQSVVFKQIKGYEKSDFRGVYGFNKHSAVLMSSGTPALILKTDNFGTTWKEVYRNNDSAVFLDAIDFFDQKNGCVIADPIDGKFQLFTSDNGGNSWEKSALNIPAYPGESLFAASNSCMRMLAKNKIVFVSGGTHSRIFEVDIKKGTVKITSVFENETNAEGLFSFIQNKNNIILACGGTYNNVRKKHHNFIQYDGLKNKLDSSMQLPGYYSGIEWSNINQTTWISTGLIGTLIGKGNESYQISNSKMHAVKISRHGNQLFFVGPNANIATIKINNKFYTKIKENNKSLNSALPID